MILNDIKIKVLQEKSIYLVQVINDIGKNLKNKETFVTVEVYIILYNRLMSNLYSISILLKEYEDQPISNSISLLFRSCISDILIGFYLLTFQNEPQTMLNEIKVLDAGFLKYIKKVLPIEQKFLSKDEKEAEAKISHIEEFIKKVFDDLIEKNKEYKILNASQIRDKFKSNKSIFTNDHYNSILTEEKMFEYLRNKVDPPFTSLFVYWRFFSQFQHFTHAGKQLNYLSKSDFIYFFTHTLILCYEFVLIVNKKILNISVTELEQNKKELINAFKSFK